VDNGRNYSLDIGTLANFINDNYAPSLDKVLETGNESLKDVKIRNLYLWDSHSNDGYNCYINGSKNRVNFYNVANGNLGYFDLKKIVVSTNPYSYSLSFPDLSSDVEVSFQNTSGTVAYLSNINSYGLASQISESTNIINTITESSLIGDTVGILSVPANTFVAGDSFDANIIGKISCLSSATIHIRIKTDSGVLLADTGVIDLSAATDKTFGLDIKFTIREIGTAGVAYIISGGSFSYNKDGSNNPEVVMFNAKNNTTFDTTILNTLEITAEWNNASTSNSIYSDIFTLNKVY
jgi:hypothetical protein